MFVALADRHAKRIPSHYPMATNMTDKWDKLPPHRSKKGRFTVFATELKKISTKRKKTKRLMKPLDVQVTRAQRSEQASIRLRLTRSSGRMKRGGET